MSFTVDISGGESLDRMGQAQQIIREELISGVDRLTMAGEHKAKSLVGVKTGHLRRSITHSRATYAGGVVTGKYGTNVPYARMHEEGTAPHTITAKGRALSFVWKGKRVAFKRVNHPGTKGRFYMRDSSRWLQTQLPAEGRAIKVRIIRRLGG